MGKILLEGMEFYAYHGHLKEEQVIGTLFLIDLEIEFETGKAEISDQLRDTVNYMEIYRCVKGVMGKKSHLLENVARRILDAVKTSFPSICSLTVKISKINPPLGGKVKQVSCILSS
ncbi:MAG: dihydroneopterin aldolase [Bacteroidetes bacterium]|nr:dihydroneopterin aldolase [Bacteroidota bacterium]